jgi:hypothetical protein
MHAGRSYLGCAIEIQLACDLRCYPLDIHDGALVCLIRLLEPLPKSFGHHCALPELCRAGVRHHVCQLDIGRYGLEQDADRLRIVHVLVSELPDELRELTLPPHEALNRVESLIVALNACRRLVSRDTAVGHLETRRTLYEQGETPQNQACDFNTAHFEGVQSWARDVAGAVAWLGLWWSEVRAGPSSNLEIRNTKR